MNQESELKSTLALFFFLAIMGLAFFVLITFFRVPHPGSIGSAQDSTQIATSFITPIPEETQTVAVITADKIIGEATHLATTRTPVTPIYLPTGIYDDQRVKISAALLFIDAQNAWGGFIDGHRFTLYAGALQSNPDQGVVYMVTSLPGGKLFEQYVTPSKQGALRVVSEQNNRLALVALDDTMFYFDIPTRQFVDSLTGVAPSVTPSPVGTPEPTSAPYPMPTSPVTEVP